MNFNRKFSVGLQSLVAAITVSALLAACGVAGGSSVNSNIISGLASKGPLNGATVCTYPS